MEDGSLFQRMRQLFQNDEKEDEQVAIEAAKLMHNIVRYMDKDAKDIMTHRRDIVAIDGEETLEHALHFMLDEPFSRYPIYKEDIDEIIGTIHIKDAMLCYFDDETRQKPVALLEDYIRPVAYIPETKSIDTLFKKMQAEKNHISIVIDEYGQTAGLVSMEDILEEIVGNIMDEYDEEENEIELCEDGSFEVNGFVELEDLEELIPVTFDKEDYETLNGFLIHQLDRIPNEGETCAVEYEGYRFVILEVDNNAIQSVKIEKVNN